MRIRWRGLELPSRVIRDKDSSTDFYGTFVVEPFERGFGSTIGNSLRRILLSSIEGAAVTHIRIKGADHEFTVLRGIAEDVTDIIHNVKGLVVKLASDVPKTMKLLASKRGPITAAMIEADPAITIVNKDHIIAKATEENVQFEMEFTVSKGRGYRTAMENANQSDNSQDVGSIAVDSIFSPVTRVRYSTEDARVGQSTNYDRLILEIWTNGAITAEGALVEAAKVLRKHLNPFVQYFEFGSEVVEDEEAELIRERVHPLRDPDLESKLNMSIQELDLSHRSYRSLESAKINTVRDLVQCTEVDLLKVRTMSKTSLREVKRRLSDLGLSLGMRLENARENENIGNSIYIANAVI